MDTRIEDAREMINKFVDGPENQVVYDIYDLGATSFDAIQEAAENLARRANELVINIKGLRD